MNVAISQAELKKGIVYTFESDDYEMTLEYSTMRIGRPLYMVYFNGAYYGFITFRAAVKKADNLVTKYNLFKHPVEIA